MNLKPFSDKRIERWIREGKKFYCFGAGAKLRLLCEKIEDFDKQIVCIADNNQKLWGTFFTTGARDIKIEDPSLISPSTNNYIVLFTTSFFREVSEQLEKSDIWRNVKTAYFFPQKVEVYFQRWYWFFSRLKVQEKIIFRSGNYQYVPGWDYTDNAKALFDYMIAEGYSKKYKMIWMVHDPKEFPEINKVDNTTAISYEWMENGNLIQKLRYFYHLRTAKYLFFTDAMYWTRFCGKEQIRVNLWHGNGFKAKKNKKGNSLNYFFDYTTVSGPLYLDLHAEYFGCDRNKVYDTGLAKEDLLFLPPEKSIGEILNIPHSKKYIFWLPTFRVTIQELKNLNEYELDSETGLPILLKMTYVKELNDLLAKHDMFLIIKLHPIQESSAVRNMNYSNIKVMTHAEVAGTGYQINTLLACADALISDFSSVAVDYVLRDKPLAFVLEDIELYNESRGFVFEPLQDYLPGKELYSFEDMKTFLADVAMGVDSSKEKRHKLLPQMHSHQDGNSRRRILELIGLKE